ncbi:MAG TPA: nucleotidyl transferase AbiEii/AbiGii toxin family protein [Polaromonas sp.]|uniref:nucleotidyl transferase AbiEii/AbiGii toxin family protein n=1 Tax=Polaromonas sp. TaxID=1869339 RepID=UPI002D285E42|nr:nucleotidyl transferase AbiEii/AbiGii toxin family protein [Polaromonas sp.]HYW57763.1 nucleotidyl transferase AbiEii/AbiGii toxin family protein [Polaromonas sp.]
MTTKLHDLSARLDLLPLAQVVRPLQVVAAPLGTGFFLMGAAARDVMLLHVYGIDTRRKTEDIDFGVMVQDWSTFEALRQALIDGGEFEAVSNDATHKLRHKTSAYPLDIVPFGGVERADRTLAWPPDEHTVFDCFGMREAMQVSHQVLLPDEVSVNVASIPALALLKITAWHDRRLKFPGRDAPDLMLYLRHYLDCNNYDHAAAEHADLFEAVDFDHEEISARLLGRDLLELIDAPATRRIVAILQPETEEQGALLLAKQSGMSLERARRIIHALCSELLQKT